MTPRHGKKFKIHVQVFESFEGLVAEDWLIQVAEKTLELEGILSANEVSIVIADDETVRELNREHRGLDENTDVLSFAFSNQGEYYGEGEGSSWSEDFDFVMPPDEEAGLGEVIISYPQAERQAQAAGHSVGRELTHLLAHGILHLLGHDHMENEEREAMQAKESVVIAQVLEDE